MNDTTIINKLENLKKLREERKITQVKLATDLEVSQELISRYEVGSSFPQQNMIIKICKYFNCSSDYLLGMTSIRLPINQLNLNSDTVHSLELYNKYQSLSSEDKKCFDRFLSFLTESK